MNLVMTLLIRNEADIIRQNLDYHRAQGVDRFLIMDHGSVDGTLDILRAYERKGMVEIFHQDDPGYYQSRWVSWMARRARTHWRADWVINNDADEFWWPLQGDLKTALASVPSGVDVLCAERHNYRPLGHCSESVLEAMFFREARSVNALGEPLQPKACHRGHHAVEVTQGNHHAHFPGSVCQEQGAPLEIFHFPVRSVSQIERKIRTGGRAYELSPGLSKGMGHAWRALYSELREQGLQSHFARQALTPDSAAAQLAAGELVRDTRLRDFMRGLRSEGRPELARRPIGLTAPKA